MLYTRGQRDDLASPYAKRSKRVDIWRPFFTVGSLLHPVVAVCDLLDRIFCSVFIEDHERNWYHWQDEHVSRCRHCRSPMPDPFTETA